MAPLPFSSLPQTPSSFLIITTCCGPFLPPALPVALPPLAAPYELFQRSLQEPQPWLCEAQIECEHQIARLSRPTPALHAHAAPAAAPSRLSRPLLRFHPRWWCYFSASCCCSLPTTTTTTRPTTTALCRRAAAVQFVATVAAPDEPPWPGPTPTELHGWLPWWVTPLFLAFCPDR